MKYPFVKQEGNKDCAVASLSMIIRYYKGYVAHEQLRDMLTTDRKGTSAYNIIKVAEYIGFKATGIKTNNLENLKLPCIAYVTINNQLNHFVVIYKIDFKKKELLIADPASSLKKMKIEDFNKLTNDIYILLYQIKKLPYLKKYSILEFITTFLKNNKNSLIKITILSFFINILITILSFEFKFLIESINYDTRLKYIFLLVFLFITILKIITTYLRNLLTIYLDKKINYDLTIECYKNIIHFPYIYYCNRTTGEVIARINDLELVKSFISKITIMILSDLPLIIISLIIMFTINIKLTLFTILNLLLYFLVIRILKNPIKTKIQNLQEERGRNTSFLVESLSAYECIKGLNIENQTIQKLQTNHYKYITNIFDFSKLYNFQIFLKDFISDIGNLILIILGIIEIESNIMTIGSFITFTYLISNFSNPLREILDTNVEVEESLNALKRILELNYKSDNNGKIKKLENNNIKIKQLNYSYNDENIISNINLEFKSGEKAIILGESGSGKSTLLKIIKKYLKVKNGIVYINNIDLNDYNNAAVSKNISYIAQNELLFTDTIYENLRVNRDLEPKRIIEVAKLCFVDEIIKNKEFGYNTLIEENGFNLSGGEKQRIILARTLLNDSKIILIDEGTNQLDVSLERKILKNIFKEFSDKIIILISHRFDNIDLFDHVIKIEKGELKEDVRYRK